MGFNLAKVVLVVALTGCQSIQPRPMEVLSSLSLDCLEARERDPTAECDDLLPENGRNVRVVFNMTQVDAEKTTQEQKVVVKFTMNQSHTAEGVALYNYPNYQDPSCHSAGEFMCDPYGYLNAAERQNISQEMAKLRSQHLVVCEDLVVEPINQRHLAPFYVGVAIAEAEKTEEMPSSSVKQYGHLIMSEWNLNSFFGNNPSSVTRCPNKALLLVLPKNGQAVLVTDGCRYLCEDTARTGYLVETQLRGKSVAQAVLLGLRDAYSTLPLSVVQGEDMPSSGAPAQDQAQDQTVQPLQPESWVLFVQRAVFAFAVMALGLSLAVGFLVMCFAPGLAKGHRGYL